MKHGVLKAIHPMLGRDKHIPWPPGAPGPLPNPVPYITCFTMLGTAATAKWTRTLFTDSLFPTMIKGTDIGPLIPHIGPPSVTMPVEMVFSASKSHFGSSRYQTEDGPPAITLGFAVNPNLNCGTPIPTLTGLVLALATHRVDMSWGDVFSGFMNMGVDFVIQSLLNKGGNWLSRKIDKLVQGKIYDRLFQAFLKDYKGYDEVLAKMYSQWGAQDMLKETLEFMPVAKYGGTAAATVIAFFTGGPMGADIGTLGGYGKDEDDEAITPGGTSANIANKATDELGHSLGQAAGDDPDKAHQDYLNDSPDWSVL